MNQAWLCHTPDLQLSELNKRLLPMLSSTELNRLDSFSRPQRCKEYLTARAMIRMALSKHYEQTLEYWQFSDSPGAPPQLLNPPRQPLFISISHSGEYVTMAISDQPVGIDIEQHRELDREQDNNLKIASKVFTPEQQQILSKLAEPARSRHFYQLWTQKEALVKAMHTHPEHFQMISTAPWPLQGMSVSQSEFEQYSIALVSRFPGAQFKQYRSRPFDHIEANTFI